MTIIIQKQDAKKRIDIFLVEYLQKYSRNNIVNAIENKIILVNGCATKASYKTKQNDQITFSQDLEIFFNPAIDLEPLNIKIDIKYEDDDLIVINKPKNLLTHPTKHERKNTLVNYLLYHCKNNLSDIEGEERQGIIHRLDKNTAGLMLVAKNNFSHTELAKQIREKSAIRKYLAIALGNFTEKKGTINKPLIHYLKENVKMSIAPEEQGLKAITNYQVIEEFKGASLVELELKTGRTHQIRVHLSSINHPIFGDKLYGANGLMRNEFYNLKTEDQLLQSYFLTFQHPRTKKTLNFQLEENDFSKDFTKVLNFLRSKNAY